MSRQHTSSIANPVGAGLARHLGRMVEDALSDYPGGTVKAELAKGHTGFSDRLYAMLDELAAEQAIRLSFSQCPAWSMTVTRSCHSEDKYRAIFEKRRIYVKGRAIDMMHQPALATSFALRNEEFPVVFLSNADLGFPNGAMRVESDRRAFSLGFEYIPAWAALELCLRLTDEPKEPIGQSESDWFLVAMESIPDYTGQPRVFEVMRTVDGLDLNAHSGQPGYFYGDHCCWAYRLRK